jgi:hypothetical protein
MSSVFHAYTVSLDGVVRYVGVTTQSVKQRWYQHVFGAVSQGKGHALGAAIRKYGRGGFVVEHVASAWDAASLNDLETLLIGQHGTFGKPNYNMTTGGDARFSFAPETIELMSAERRGRVVSEETKAKHRLYRHTEESRAKMSASRVGRKLSPEHIAKTAAFHTGRKRPAETGAKISEKAKNRSVETRERMAAAQRGKKMSPEAIEKTAAKNRGRKRSAEYVANLRAKLLGVPKSSEHKAKLRAATLSHYAKMRSKDQLELL